MGKVKGRGQAAILSPQQIEQIIAIARPPYRLAIAIAAYTGCRMGEAIALRAENVHPGAIIFTQTKTGDVREVPLHPKLKALLEAAKLPQLGYLFPSNGGKKLPHITRQAVWRELTEICEGLGIQGVGTHSFRRSALTLLKDAGIPLADIAAISGHRSLDQLNEYLEVSDNQKAAAIASLPY